MLLTLFIALLSEQLTTQINSTLISIPYVRPLTSTYVCGTTLQIRHSRVDLVPCVYFTYFTGVLLHGHTQDCFTYTMVGGLNHVSKKPGSDGEKPINIPRLLSDLPTYRRRRSLHGLDLNLQ